MNNYILQLAHHKLIFTHKESRRSLYTLFMYLCYLTGTFKDVVKGEKIQWNPDTQGITVSTDSTVGSNDAVGVNFYDNDGYQAGGVYIYFRTQTTYGQYGCTYNNIFTAVPAAPDKTWTITYNTVEQRLALYCNGVQVLNVLLSDSVCTQSNWRTYWERKPTQKQFQSGDTASGSYCFSNPGKYNGDFRKPNTAAELPPSFLNVIIN